MFLTMNAYYANYILQVENDQQDYNTSLKPLPTNPTDIYMQGMSATTEHITDSMEKVSSGNKDCRPANWSTSDATWYILYHEMDT